MAVGLTVSRDADVPALFRIGLMRSVPFLLARFQEAESHAREIDRKQAQRVLSYMIKLDQAWPQVCELLIAMAPKMEQAGHRDDWIVYLESGIEKSQKLGNEQTKAELCLYLGELYQYQAKYCDARCQFEFSLGYFEKVGDLHYQVRALNSLANVARRQRDFEQAKQLVHTTLELLGDEKAERANSYLVLGSILFDQHKWSDAYDFFSKSLVLSEQVNNQRMIAWALTNLGVVKWILKKYESAIAYYQRAINQLEIIQDPVHLALARMNLGNVYVELDRFELALELYLLAQPVFHKTQDKLRLAMLNNNKGMAYQKLQQWDKAAQAYSLGINLWEQIGNIGALVNVMDNLGLAYLEQGLYDKARAMYQDALKQLAQIKSEPSYEGLLTMLTTHLRDAMQQQTRST